MINLSIFNFCDWWWFWWLLPFLLGLLLGWAIWAKWRKMYDDAMTQIGNLKTTISGLEADLEACRKKSSSLASEVALLNGRIREKQSELDACLAAAKANSGQANVANAISATPPVAAASIVSSIAATPTPTPAAGSTDKFGRLESNNLQIIEGIGPKMESVLHENGVHTWAELSGKSNSDLRTILDKYGDKYRIIDPNDWADQAKLAANGKWNDLIALQKGLGSTTGDETDSKLEKVMIKLGLLKQWKQDDLKAVEGIGPKIEGILQAAGINTWAGLASTTVDKLRSLLSDAGDRYKLADPGTWPKQADMAAKGQWDELEKYQDYLQGGKDPS
jgi:predicted flap endonuclease-1-like 5' DNA nuclease